MQSDLSTEGLREFIRFVREKGLASKSTAEGWQVSVGKLLDELPDIEDRDVREIDLDAAVRRFSNKNPGLLSPKSLGEYQRRVAQSIGEFVTWASDPAAYKPRGRTRSRKRDSSSGKTARPTGKQAVLLGGSSHQLAGSLPPSALSLTFPLRDNFLAQFVLPRDMKSDEARRLGAFLLTLAMDYGTAS
jgi:hypothetical protein